MPFYGMKEPSDHEKAVIRRWQRMKMYKHNLQIKKEREEQLRKDNDFISKAIKNNRVDFAIQFAPNLYIYNRLLEYRDGLPYGSLSR